MCGITSKRRRNGQRSPESIVNFTGISRLTLLDLALHNQAPNANYPYVVVTGLNYATTHSNGLPESKDLEHLQTLGQKIVDAIESVTPTIWAGTFFHDGQQLQYVYVKNSNGVEDALRKFYAGNCTACTPYIHIKEDRKWEVYSDFLYPNQAVRDANKEELAQLEHPDASARSAACMPGASVEDMFAHIRAKTKWDLDHDMVWGYFFVAKSAKPLPGLAAALKKGGYQLVDDMHRDDRGQYWLHVEKIETHSVESLDRRDREFCDLAATFPDVEYDGMDVGPVGGEARK